MPLGCHNAMMLRHAERGQEAPGANIGAVEHRPHCRRLSTLLSAFYWGCQRRSEVPRPCNLWLWAIPTSSEAADCRGQIDVCT